MNNAIKQIVLCMLLIFTFYDLKAQNHTIDSLKEVIKKTTKEADKIDNLNFLASLLNASNPSEAIKYASQASILAKTKRDTAAEVMSYIRIAIAYSNISRYDTAKILLNQAIEICKKIGHKKQESSCLNTLGNIHLDLSEKKEALACFLNALNLSEEIKDSFRIPMRLVNIGRAHLSDKNFTQHPCDSNWR